MYKILLYNDPSESETCQIPQHGRLATYQNATTKGGMNVTDEAFSVHNDIKTEGMEPILKLDVEEVVGENSGVTQAVVKTEDGNYVIIADRAQFIVNEESTDSEKDADDLRTVLVESQEESDDGEKELGEVFIMINPTDSGGDGEDNKRIDAEQSEFSIMDHVSDITESENDDEENDNGVHSSDPEWKPPKRYERKKNNSNAGNDACYEKEKSEALSSAHEGSRQHPRFPKLCHQCGTMIETSKKWRQHQKVHYKKQTVSTSRILLCEQCGRQFRDLWSLSGHIRAVHKPRELAQCDQCHRKFATSTRLNYHIKRIHLGIRTKVCDICKKSFKTDDALKVHKRIHSDEKPFACNFCEYRGRQRHALNWHLRSTHQVELAVKQGFGRPKKSGTVEKKTKSRKISKNKSVACPDSSTTEDKNQRDD